MTGSAGRERQPDETNPRGIANERIDILLKLATECAKGRPERARKYVGLARKIGARFNVRLGERKRLFCRECLLPLVPGSTCIVRIAKGGRQVTTCVSCGTRTVRRILPK